MSQKKSKIWTIALPLSVVFLSAAYYVKMPEVRKWVDARTPVVRNLLGRYVQEPVVTIVMKGEQDPAFANAPKRAPAPVKVPEPPAPEVTKAPEPVAPPMATPPPPPAPVALDLQKLATTPSLWPKTVVLSKPTTFPAVLNGKTVGSLVAPAGTEANLVAIRDEKLGVVFNGGGTWLTVDQTDFATRVQTPR